MQKEDIKKIMNIPFWINIAIIFLLIIKVVFISVFHLVFWFELVTDIVMCALGILLILFYKRGKNKGIGLANGIIAIIPFINFSSLILSLLWIALRDSKDKIISVENIKKITENIKDAEIIKDKN